MAQINLLQNAVSPGTPASGKIAVYAKDDQQLYMKDDAGAETCLSISPGSTGEANWLTSVSGTDTITASNVQTIAAYAAGMVFRFKSAGANTGAVTININSVGAEDIKKNGTTALVAGDIPNGATAVIVHDGTSFQLVTVSSVEIDNSIQDFRLTLTTAVPVTTSDVTGATTIYCTPYKGNRIAIYDGTSWNIRTSAEFSLALGTLTSGKPYDVFCYDNAGTPTLEFLVWTNDTTRATALAYQDGVLVKSGDATRRYLGTFYTTAATTTEDSETKRYLWNYYNRVERRMRRIESTNSWTYTTATWRQANGSASNQLNFVQGVAEDCVNATVRAEASNSSGAIAIASGIALDSTTTPDYSAIGYQAAGNYCSLIVPANYAPQLGRHYIAWLEYSAPAGTTTWYGAVSAPAYAYGLIGSVMA